MRNDARPVGRHSPASPVGGDRSPMQSEHHDDRDSHAHGRQSHVVNKVAEQRGPATPEDPVTPSSDASLNTKI